MWPTAPERRRIPLRAAALISAGVLTLVAGVAAYATTRSDQPELAAATRGVESSAAGNESVAGERYRDIVEPANAAKADLQQFLASVPPVTPRSEIDRRVAEYAAVARRADAALEDGPWPAKVRGAVEQLVEADVVFTGELARNAGHLNQPGYSDRLVAGAATVRAAANRVRAAIGLIAVPLQRDQRFAPL